MGQVVEGDCQKEPSNKKRKKKEKKRAFDEENLCADQLIMQGEREGSRENIQNRTTKTRDGSYSYNVGAASEGSMQETRCPSSLIYTARAPDGVASCSTGSSESLPGDGVKNTVSPPS